MDVYELEYYKDDDVIQLYYDGECYDDNCECCNCPYCRAFGGWPHRLCDTYDHDYQLKLLRKMSIKIKSHNPTFTKLLDLYWQWIWNTER